MAGYVSVLTTEGYRLFSAEEWAAMLADYRRRRHALWFWAV